MSRNKVIGLESSAAVPKKVVPVYLEGNLYELLRACSFVTKRTMSELIRESLRKYLKEYSLPDYFRELKEKV